jgi:hypothetical protein
MLCRVLAFSKLLREPGLRTRKVPWFSWPGLVEDSPDDEEAEEHGVVLPAEEEEMFRARFVGLFGEDRVRVEDLDEELPPAPFDEDLPERKDNLVLGRKGVASDDWASSDCVVGALLWELKGPKGCEAMRRREGEAGEGEFGEFDEVADTSEPCEAVRARWNLDGERDIERLRDRTAACTSMWFGWVGLGNVRVPPPLLPNDIAVERWNARGPMWERGEGGGGR